MTRRNRRTTRKKNNQVKKLLFNKWTLLAILSTLTLILAVRAFELKNGQAMKPKQSVSTLKNDENHNHLDAAFKDYQEKMKPRLEFTKLKKSHYPELKKEILTALKKEHFSGSVLAIKNNKLIVNSAIGYNNKQTGEKNTKDSEYMLASIQKSFTAAGIMTLIEDNLLTLNTPLSVYYPEIPNSDFITIRNLLDMSSGLDLIDFNRTALNEDQALDEILQNIYSQPFGNKWFYSSVNYNLLAGVIKKVSGKSYQDFITEKIIVPLNLKHTGFYKDLMKQKDPTLNYRSSLENPYATPLQVSEEKYASEIGTGNMYSTTSDLMTYFQGIIDGHILRKNNLNTLMTQGVMPFNFTYASGVYDRGDYILAHGIFLGFESTIILSKDGSTGIVFLANTFNKEFKSQPLVQELFQKINTSPSSF